MPSKPRSARKKASSYDIVTDVATGPNIRKKDNLYQAIVAFVGAAIGAGLGYTIIVLATPQNMPGGPINPMVGVVVGSIVGPVVGTLICGGFLMVYRLFRH